MGIAMNTDLMAGLDDHLRCARKALHRMPRDAPGRDDSVPLEEIDEAWHSALGAEHAARDVARRVLAAKRADPKRDRIEMRIDANLNILLRSHRSLLSRE